MTIYAKKDRHGKPTGKWAVEVMVHGERHRDTTDTHEEALRIEAQFKATAKGGAPVVVIEYAPPGVDDVTARLTRNARSYTVGFLKRDAKVVWKGDKNASQSLQRFDLACDLLGLDTLLSTVRTDQLDDLVAKLRERSLGDATIHRYLSALSAAMTWAVSRDKLTAKPVFPWPAVGKGRDTVLTEEDDKRIQARLKKTGSPDVALVYDTLLATGARISEVLGLVPDDIGDDTVTFRDTKNGDSRMVFIEEALADRLAALAAVGFPTYRRVSTVLHSARKALKIEYKVTPHVLRHTAGTRLDAHGASLKTIARQLGHRNLKTTMGYIHPEVETMREAANHLKRS